MSKKINAAHVEVDRMAEFHRIITKLSPAQREILLVEIKKLMAKNLAQEQKLSK